MKGNRDFRYFSIIFGTSGGYHLWINAKLFINQEPMWLNLYGSLVLVLVWSGIEIMNRSFENSSKLKKNMKNGIFTLFVGVSMETLNTQTDF